MVTVHGRVIYMYATAVRVRNPSRVNAHEMALLMEKIR